MTSGQDSSHPDGMGGCQFGSLSRTTPTRSSMDTNKSNVCLLKSHGRLILKSNVCQCLSRATGQIPKSNVCLVQLGQFPSQMFVSCNWEDPRVKCLSGATAWAERPHDCMIMDQTHKVKSCSCAIPRSNVSLMHLDHTAT